MASKPKPTPDEPVALADHHPVTGQRTRHDGGTAERQSLLTGLAAENLSGPHLPQHSPSPHPAKAAPQRPDLDK